MEDGREGLSSGEVNSGWRLLDKSRVFRRVSVTFPYGRQHFIKKEQGSLRIEQQIHVPAKFAILEPDGNVKKKGGKKR